MFRYISLCFMILTTCWACKSKQYALSAPDTWPQEQLQFGWGGGFAGTRTEFVLLENGQLFKKPDFSTTMVELLPIKKRAAKKFMKQAQMLKSHDGFNHPGNMYQYFALQDMEGKKYQMTFGDVNQPIDSTISQFHKTLKMLVIKRETKEVVQ